MNDDITSNEFGELLEKFIEMVLEQGHQLQARVEVQDVKIKKILKAYLATGVAVPNYAKSLTDPIRAKMRELVDEEPFWEKYRQTNAELENLREHLKEENYPVEVVNKTEKVVYDLLVLLHFWWALKSSHLGVVVKQAEASRAYELSKLDEYLALKPTLADAVELQSAEEFYSKEKIQLMEQQFELFQTEQDILDDMELICDERDRLFSVSEELFLR